MDIYYKSKQIEKVCNQAKEGIKELGPEIAKKLRMRMTELKAADVLSDISHLPPARLHELDGGRDGEVAVDLKHPFRLIFKPYGNYKKGEPIDKTQVTAITILEVSNYHGKQKK